MKEKKFKYDDALIELKQILQDIQSDQTGIDQLSSQIARSKELINLCKTRLREIESSINPDE
ncbi:MAG TPA: exodeoxyribonuclease VII small subunit [Saprospiraceae bacterium]|nr:exodeoxyribonuclease VII small subunit [Saprospiraceae bacterium]HPN71112.1 exodeoxyribonuclease VII small subunit [Saprospiraceae bacterium]